MQKTKYFFKKGLSINEIAKRRGIKEATVWQHLAKLIEYNRLKVEEVLTKEKIKIIRPKIRSKNDTLTEIKAHIKDAQITFNELDCVRASIKAKEKKRNIFFHLQWYKKVHCTRKCYDNPEQRNVCAQKCKELSSKNRSWELEQKEFLEIFNMQINICILQEQQKKRYISWQEFKKNNSQKIKEA